MGLCIEELVCKGCGICVNTCPKEILTISNRRNAKGINIVEITDEAKCIECKICENICPDLAIWVCDSIKII